MSYVLSFDIIVSVKDKECIDAWMYKKNVPLVKSSVLFKVYIQGPRVRSGGRSVLGFVVGTSCYCKARNVWVLNVIIKESAILAKMAWTFLQMCQICKQEIDLYYHFITVKKIIGNDEQVHDTVAYTQLAISVKMIYFVVIHNALLVIQHPFIFST